MKYYLVACGLTIGNFLSNDFEIALERSYFQGVTCLVLWIIGLAEKKFNA